MLIKNCIAGNSHILLENGCYQVVTRLKKGEKIINKYGRASTVNDIIDCGKQRVVHLQHEAWHTVTKVTHDQYIMKTLDDSKLVIPSNIDLEFSPNPYYDYNIGIIYAILLYSAFITKDKCIFFLKKDKDILLKQINVILADVFQVNKVSLYSGYGLIKYEIPTSCLPPDLNKTLENRIIVPSLLSQTPGYINGLYQGFMIAEKLCERFDTRDLHVNLLCNWLNINIDGEKSSRYYIDDDETYIENVFDIITDDNSFIANNIICSKMI